MFYNKSAVFYYMILFIFMFCIAMCFLNDDDDDINNLKGSNLSKFKMAWTAYKYKRKYDRLMKRKKKYEKKMQQFRDKQKKMQEKAESLRSSSKIK